MKKNRRKYSLTIILIMLTLSLFRPFVPASAEYDYTLLGGKHNGPVNVDPISRDEGFSAILYNNTNGLPTSEANDIVETAEGFIWIGSYAGLIRYDGSRFERMDDISGHASIKCLLVDSSNGLWIGTNDNGIILVENDGTIRRWNKESGLRSLSVRSLAEGSDGTIYAATTEGLVLIDQERQLSYINDMGLSEAFFLELRNSADGKTYALSNPGDLYALENGKLLDVYRFSESSFKGINSFLPDPEDPDLFYVETHEGLVYHDTLQGGFEDSEAIDIGLLDQVQSFEYFDGDVWICFRNGAGVLQEDGFHALKNVPMNNSIGHVMTDYAGNLWFTSTREGVMKIVKNRFSDLFERYDLPARVVNSTCMYEDQLFVATDNGLIVIGQDGPIDDIPLNEQVQIYGEGRMTNDLIEMLDNCRIRSIICDSKDRLWIATWRRYGLLCYDHGDLKAFSKQDGLASDAMRTICECDDGRILTAGNGGVSVIEDDEVVAVYAEESGITNTDVLTVSQGEGDDILVGTDGAGIFIISDEGTRHIGSDEGLSSGSVMRIKHSDTEDVYWVITGNSLSYLNEDYELTNVDKFPYPNNFDVYESNNGELWVLSSDGIYVTTVRDILNDEKLDPIHFGLTDGLPCISTANSYSEVTDEGDLYIAGTSSVAKVNIEEGFGDLDELRFGIPYVEADGKIIYKDEYERFTIPSDTKRLTIYGRVFSYSLRVPLISCRLDGFDESDTVGYAKDIFPLDYTNLRGGEYNFIMQLNNSLTGDSVGTSVQIIKEKAVHEQVGFYVFLVISSLLLLASSISMYIHHREALLEKKHKEDTERQRIKDEMKLASDIQQSTLPHIFPDRQEFEVFASMDPAKEVGGDFYDCYFIDDDHLCLVMADVSGKGIPGALFMMISKAIIANTAAFADSPAKILTMTNDTICSNNPAGMFVTVWLGILELSTGKVKAANAGHEYPIMKTPDGVFEIVKDKHGLVIGAYADHQYKEYELDLLPGSKLFLYTDGIPEATDKDEQLFGMARLIDALNKDPEAKPRTIMDNVRQAVDDFVKDAEQFDDLTMMCFEYKGAKKDQ